MNKRIKKIGCIVIISMLLTACSDKNVGTNEDIEKLQNKKEVTHIVMTFQSVASSRLDDLDKVMDAVNAITIPEIGVEVEAKVIDAVDAFTKYFLWISNGEIIDLMMLNYQDINAYISRGMLLSIDELLNEQAPDIIKIMEEGYYLTEGSISQGKAYGIVTVPANYGSGGGLWVSERYVKEAGLDYDKYHIYSLDELTMWFQKWKELYPDKYPLGQITSGNTYSTMNYYMGSTDAAGGDIFTGVLIEPDSTTLSNIFSSDLYKNFIYQMREWYLSGYIYPDSAITDANIMELISSGLVMTCPLVSKPGMLMGSIDENMICLRTSEVTNSPQYAKSGFWTIPSTSSSKEAAMRFLNMMYGDARISNLLQCGIEGEHYVIVDEENGLISYPEGLDASNISYINSLGLYGDARKNYMHGSSELKNEMLEYTKEALNNQKGFSGFIYSTANVDKKIDAVQKVVEKYIPFLESGSVDPDLYYKEFLRELELAGIEDIITDKQAQLDEWLKEQ